MPAAEVDVRVDTTDFRRLLGRSSQVEATLRTVLRRNIRNAADPAVRDVRTAALRTGRTASSSPQNRGLRAGIAAGVKLSVMTGAKSGVTITASSTQMPAGKQTLVRAWESQKGWRHPVFARDSGGTSPWERQFGNPFFRSAVAGHLSAVTSAVQAAMAEAAASLGVSS